jgi:hypothetical protein
LLQGNKIAADTKIVATRVGTCRLQNRLREQFATPFTRNKRGKVVTAHQGEQSHHINLAKNWISNTTTL